MREKITAAKITPDGGHESIHIDCISEHNPDIFVGGSVLYHIVCTSQYLKELTAGRLYTDGILTDNESVSITISDDMHSAFVITAECNDLGEQIYCDTVNAPHRKQQLKQVKGEYPGKDTVFQLSELFSHDNGLHGATGGSHRCILFTSGRVPVDMAEKVIAAGIPVLVTKSVLTVQAAKLAKKYGLTLICKAWNESFVLL